MREVCLSFNKSASGDVAVVTTELPEDGCTERAFIVHEAWQNALVKDLHYQNAVDQSASTGRPGF